jgi:hypothetical protein
MKNFFKTLFLLLGISSVAYIIYQQTIVLDTPGKIFAKKFEDDMTFLHQNGHLPKMWDNLKEVKFVTPSKAAANWLAQATPTIATINDGKYILEYVLIDDSEPANQTTIALVQMSILEVVSNNKIWELTRIYSLDDEDEDAISKD